MKLGKYSGGKYWKAAHLDTPVDLTIRNATEEQFEDGPKAVLWFREDARGLVVNRSIADQLVKMFGTDDTDAYIDEKVQLFNDTSVFFKGRQSGGVRVRPVSTVKAITGDGDTPF